MMNKEESIVPMVSARRIYGVDEYVRTDGRIIPVYIYYPTEKLYTLPALSVQPLKPMKIVNFLT